MDYLNFNLKSSNVDDDENLIKRRKYDWESKINLGIYQVRENPKDEKYCLIYENDVVIGSKCSYCSTFISGLKPNGRFYRHIKNCAINSGITPNVKNEQKEKFEIILKKFMNENLIPNYLFENEIFHEMCQTLLNIGFDSCKEKHHIMPPKINDLMPDVLVDFNVLNSDGPSPIDSDAILKNLKQEPFHNVPSEVSENFDDYSGNYLESTSSNLDNVDPGYKLDGDFLIIDGLKYFDARGKQESFLCRNCLGFGKMTEAKVENIMKLESPHHVGCRQLDPKTTSFTGFDLNQCQIFNDSLYFKDLQFIDPLQEKQNYYCVKCLQFLKVTKLTKKITVKVTSEHCQECHDSRQIPQGVQTFGPNFSKKS